MIRTFIIGLILILWLSADLQSRETMNLTLDRAVDIAIDNSYRTKHLEIEIQRSLSWLKARKAGLKTQVYMNLKSPDLQNVSEYKWNSTLYKDEIVRQNTELWQGDLSIKQPVIFFGYPTNGYLSLNYLLNRYRQLDNENNESVVDLYNRLYLKFEQPFFLPNELKNDLEEAELNLEDVKLRYVEDRLDIIEDISRDYYRIFQFSYKDIIYSRQIKYLKQALRLSMEKENSSNKNNGSNQIRLEMNNIREKLLSSRSGLRRHLVDIKQRLRINATDSIYVSPDIQFKAINVDLEQALIYGYELNPRIRRMSISKQRDEIDISNAKARNAFHMTLEMTYGMEKKNHYLETLWDRFDNSKSISLNAYVPIWDGGARKARIQAEKLGLKRTELRIQEYSDDIHNDILNAYTNLKEYYDRLINMQESRDLAENITGNALEEYAQSLISTTDLLQMVNRYGQTEENFLEIYLDYRTALRNLVSETYFDFEKNRPLTDEFESTAEDN